MPTEAEKIILDRDLRNKHEAFWKARTEGLVEDLEAAKLAIHNLMQENMSLKITIEKNSEESERYFHLEHNNFKKKFTLRWFWLF